jgi:hypothetical protein
MRRTILSALVAAVALLPAAAPAHARPVSMEPQKQPVVHGFYRGRTVGYFDFGPIKLRPGNRLAPIWAFTNAAPGQRNVVDTVPGRKDYSPLWQVSMVTWTAGTTPRVLKSAAAVKAAAAAGDVRIVRTKVVVNCPVLGFGQKKVAGFSRGKTIQYYDLGPVKVAPGNRTLPLWAVTNGVAGQHNVADVTPGRTAYPPLWAIVEVTWKQDATPRLLTSLAAIRKAESAGEVTLKPTSLVVNCPLV